MGAIELYHGSSHRLDLNGLDVREGWNNDSACL